jgi:hypothetical protein
VRDYEFQKLRVRYQTAYDTCMNLADKATDEFSQKRSDAALEKLAGARDDLPAAFVLRDPHKDSQV